MKIHLNEIEIAEIDDKDILVHLAEEYGVKMSDFEIIYTTEEYEKQIQNHIKTNYPSVKQESDTNDINYYRTTLVHEGVENIESLVVELTQLVQAGATVAEAVADQPEEIQEGIAQLVKASVRNAWMMYCKREYKLAVAEDREMVLPPFPVV